MITIGNKAPEFTLEGVLKNAVSEYVLNTTSVKSWLILFFYPADFSFICPTELRNFRNHFNELGETKLWGISVDDIECHKKWINELGGLPFPLLSDIGGKVAEKYQALGPDVKANRATFIIDPEGIVQSCTIVTANIGRSVEETIRTLKALQTGSLCPADWKPGQETISR
ncbi:MAG: redoxin domain-containing protein [Candidatus Hodarchaeales archaeon]|jgi:alkyl hydroperoxide reductase subunit AhpC